MSKNILERAEAVREIKKSPSLKKVKVRARADAEIQNSSTQLPKIGYELQSATLTSKKLLLPDESIGNHPSSYEEEECGGKELQLNKIYKSVQSITL